MPDLPRNVEDYLAALYPAPIWIAKGSPWERARNWLQRHLGWP